MVDICRAPGCTKPIYRQRKDLCEHHYRNLRVYGQFEAPIKEKELHTERCAVDGCPTKPRSAYAKYCEKHYGQMRRNGYIGKFKRPDLIDHSAGYNLLKAPGHRLATDGNPFRVYEHRAEFYAHFGEGPFRCEKCQVELEWDAVCVCRHDADKKFNDISNLFISCRECVQKNCISKMHKWREENWFRYIEWNGKRKTITDWANELGIKPQMLFRRLGRGWSIEDALSTPKGRTKRPRPKRLKLTTAQVSEIREMAGAFPREEIGKAFGISKTTVGRIVTDPNWGNAPT